MKFMTKKHGDSGNSCNCPCANEEHARGIEVFSLETGMKIKHCEFTPNPMPDSIIKKVEHFQRWGAPASVFDFSNRSGILFEWDNKVDKSPQSLVEDNVVPYPSLEAVIPGVPLTRDQPVLIVKDDIPVQGHTKDQMAQNAGFELLKIAEVD